MASLSGDDLLALADVARKAAKAAGEFIFASKSKDFAVSSKASGGHIASQIVTDIDVKSEALILQYLQPSIERFGFGVLTEETEDDRTRHSQDYFWCVDPLDGTLAFAELKAGYAVSIALVSKVGESVLGVVYEPETAALYSAVKGQGVIKNGHDIVVQNSVHSHGGLDVFVLPCDRGFLESPGALNFIQLLQKWCALNVYPRVQILYDHGAVASACRVLDSPGCYFKRPKVTEGGGSLWDFAATACLFAESGIFASDFNGNALQLNSATTFMNERGVFFSRDKQVMQVIKTLLVEANKSLE